MSMYLLLEPQTDELYHHGILGMHWGIRRYQPYQPGAKVKGGKEVGIATKVKQRVTGISDGIKKHKAAKKKAAALKKAQATRKANADYAAAKKKAIESGSIEELAKYKGDLTNEEYSKAFLRLQNEKRMSDMVDANKTTVFDKIDKGMAVVSKLAGYANTVADFKEKTDRMTTALDKKKKEANDKREEKEKNAAITSIESLTELDRVQKKYNLNPDEYSKGLKILQTKLTGEQKQNSDALEGRFQNQDRKAEREKEAQDKADREAFKAKLEADKEARRAQKAYDKVRKVNNVMDGTWTSEDSSKKDTAHYKEVGSAKANDLLSKVKDKVAETTPLSTPETRPLSSETTSLNKPTKASKTTNIGENKVVVSTYTRSKAAQNLYNRAKSHTASQYDKAVKERGSDYINSLRNKSWETLTSEEKSILTTDSSRRIRG